MISDLRIQGYKSLLDVHLQTGSLNVLVGANASGKSSVLQTLLLLRQSANGSKSTSQLQLSGPLFEAGTIRDVLHPEARAGLRLELHSTEANGGHAVFSPRSYDDIGNIRVLQASALFELPSALSDLTGYQFAYLNAERMGPRVSYGLTTARDMITGVVGMYGEFTAAFLAKCQQENLQANSDWFGALYNLSQSMPEDMILDEGSKKNLARLDLVAKQIIGWLIPGTEFEAAEQSSTDSARLTYIRDPSGTRTHVRPTHMGFGVTYVLSVIAAALALRSNGLLLLENPEAHLHPLAQSRMGTFLALVAAQGVQVLVETHSEHVINGIRLAAKSNLVNSADVRFLYFRKNPRNDSSEVKQLTLSSEGQISYWPEGFFDQIERDLARL